uniref:CNNOS1-like protein n=1 Tax=Philodina roseola TaxID=96448 RepID=B6S343_PHIRO|nr:CNNOS1-like protein [Philodina roseola]
METSLGRGHSIPEEFGLTDFYSPPSSLIDDIDEREDELFYPEDEQNDELNSIVPSQDPTLPSSLIDEINCLNLSKKYFFRRFFFSFLNENEMFAGTVKSPEGATPPPTPLNPSRSIVPSNLTLNGNADLSMTNWSLGGTSTTDMRNANSLFSRPIDQTSKTTNSQFLAPLPSTTTTTFERYLAEQRRLSDSIPRSSTTLDFPLNNRPSSLSGSNPEIPLGKNEKNLFVSSSSSFLDISRLYSYMSPVEDISSPSRLSSTTPWSTSDDSLSQYSMSSRMTGTNPYGSSVQLKTTSWLPNANPFIPKSNGTSNYQTSPTTPTTASSSQSMINPFQSQNSWLLSEMSAMLRQNQHQQTSMVTLNSNITLSTTAQQILASNMNNGNNNNNNRPLRSEKIDIEIIKHLIREAKWKRQCGLKKEVCVFCRNNGENELIYSSHSLKDSLGNVTCPILRAYQCPICGATGAQAHTIKYCQATGDDNNQHIPTPYEKMIRTQCMQSFGFDDNFTSQLPPLFDPLAASPSSLYTNGWSNSYL